jgi:hypothetical protein
MPRTSTTASLHDRRSRHRTAAVRTISIRRPQPHTDYARPTEPAPLPPRTASLAIDSVLDAVALALNSVTVLDADDKATLRDMENKYCQLRWYSRRVGYGCNGGEVIATVADSLRGIEASYPDETARLNGPDGDLAQSFYHGILATLRLVLGANEVLDCRADGEGLVVMTLDDLLDEFPDGDA